MDDPQAAKPFRFYIIILSLLQIYGAAQAIYAGHGEFQSSSMVWISLGFDIATTVILFPLLIKIYDEVEPTTARTAALVLGPVGIICGLIQIAARLSSHHGWWTGHF
jgi:hypothetical protein